MVAGGAESTVNLQDRHHRLFAQAKRAFHMSIQRPADRGDRGRGTRPATASSWAKAPVSSCWKSMEHAKRTGRQHLRRGCRLRPLSGDAHHITSPHREWRRRRSRAMRNGTEGGRNWNPGDVDYINAHSTSTPWPATIVELRSESGRVFGNELSGKRSGVVAPSPPSATCLVRRWQRLSPSILHPGDSPSRRRSADAEPPQSG